MIIARNSCDSKSFPVCGHLCGQSCFLARFPGQAKSRKHPLFKGFRASGTPIVNESAYAPKPHALPTALIPVTCAPIQPLIPPKHSFICHTATFSAHALLILLICRAKSRYFCRRAGNTESFIFTLRQTAQKQLVKRLQSLSSNILPTPPASLPASDG